MLAKKYSLELVASEIFSPQLKTLYRNHLKDHYASLAKYLERQHKDLQNMERQNRRTLQVCFDSLWYLGHICLFRPSTTRMHIGAIVIKHFVFMNVRLVVEEKKIKQKNSLQVVYEVTFNLNVLFSNGEVMSKCFC